MEAPTGNDFTFSQLERRLISHVTGGHPYRDPCLCDCHAGGEACGPCAFAELVADNPAASDAVRVYRDGSRAYADRETMLLDIDTALPMPCAVCTGEGIHTVGCPVGDPSVPDHPFLPGDDVRFVDATGQLHAGIVTDPRRGTEMGWTVLVKTDAFGVVEVAEEELAHEDDRPSPVDANPREGN